MFLTQLYVLNCASQKRHTLLSDFDVIQKQYGLLGTGRKGGGGEGDNIPIATLSPPEWALPVPNKPYGFCGR